MIIRPGDLVVDYSFQPPTPDELLAAGVRCVVRYQPGAKGKGFTVLERDALAARGIAIVANFETYVNRPLEGGPAGRADGVSAAAAWGTIGYPAGLVIICSVDIDVKPVNVGAISLYGHEFATGLSQYAFGDYGDRECSAALADVSKLVWAPAAGAWGRPVNPQVVQHGGRALGSGTVDLNDVLVPFDAWLPGETRPTPVPPASPTTEVILSELQTLVLGPNDSVGSTGAQVANCQALLLVHGIPPVPGDLLASLDGKYGPMTANAVLTFQRKKGLTPDRVCGLKETWPALLDVAG